MKKLIPILVCLFVISSSLVFAKSYKVKSKDGEVSHRDKVKVEETSSVEQIKVVTLRELKNERGRLVIRIANAQAELVELDARIAAVQVEADKVTLKP